MRRQVAILAALVVSLSAAGAAAQPLAQLIPNLYGSSGLIVNSERALPNGQTHSAHFNSSFQQSFTPFNTALASQLAAVPLPSPASSFTYTFDAGLGVYHRSTQSFGPILSDRAETIGKRQFSMGLSYQQFSFDSIDGQDLDAVPVVFTHDDPVAGTGREDLVTTQNSIEARLGQFTTFLNYGLTDRLDVSLAVPVVRVDLKATSVATVQRIGTNDPAIHFFGLGHGAYGNLATFGSSGSATGLGDVILRVKGTVLKRGGTGLALGGDVRFATGDEQDLLGSGAAGLEPFLVFSSAHKRFSPHVKLAYQWNGDSVLAGDVLTGEKGDLPDQFFFELGADVRLTNTVTMDVDFLGRRVIDGERMVADTFRALDGHSTFANVRFEPASFNVLNGSLGFKFNPGGNLLIDLNVLFKLDEHGLRDNLTPLVGFEYSF